MDGVVEVMSGRARRRRWSLEDKLRAVAELEEPGARACDVSTSLGICQGLLFTWRRQVRDGVLSLPEPPSFVPVRMHESPSGFMAATPSPEPRHAPPPHPRGGVIEIELGNGRQVRVGSDVNLAALRRVLAALRG